LGHQFSAVQDGSICLRHWRHINVSHSECKQDNNPNYAKCPEGQYNFIICLSSTGQFRQTGSTVNVMCNKMNKLIHQTRFV